MVEESVSAEDCISVSGKMTVPNVGQSTVGEARIDGAPRQPDLFASLTPPYSPPSEDEERLGWEDRALSDLSDHPHVYCFPGFMGSVHERLVAKGYATAAPAGFMAPPAELTPRQLKTWGWREEDHRQFEYAITDAGRALLAADGAPLRHDHTANGNATSDLLQRVG